MQNLKTDIVKVSQSDLQELIGMLRYEQALRQEAERKLIELTPEERPKKERKSGLIQEFTSDGRPIKTASDSIRSYNDYLLLKNHFEEKGKWRDSMLWTVGIATGLRIEDVLSLQFGHIFDRNWEWRDCVRLYEQKTGKAQEVLLTEAIRVSVERYIDHLKNKPSLSDPVFKGCGTRQRAFQIIRDGAKNAGLDGHITPHSMRHTFSNIVACCDKHAIDSGIVAKVQGLLNHSDSKTTMKYLGAYRELYRKARETVSDFLLGRTEVKDLNLALTTDVRLQDVMDKLEEICGRI